MPGRIRRICLLVRDDADAVRVGGLYGVEESPEGDAFLARELAPETVNERGFPVGGSWQFQKLPLELDPTGTPRPVVGWVEDIHEPTRNDTRTARAGWGSHYDEGTHTFTNDLPPPPPSREQALDQKIAELEAARADYAARIAALEARPAAADAEEPSGR